MPFGDYPKMKNRRRNRSYEAFFPSSRPVSGLTSLFQELSRADERR